MSTDATETAAHTGAAIEARRKVRRPYYRQAHWVKETRFGHWFLGTNVWARYVVEVALRELARLVPPDARRPARILDAGSGPGVSIVLLDQLFSPDSILAIDIDPKEVKRSTLRAEACRCPVEVRAGDVARIDLPDGSVDMVLCHQLLHHLVPQRVALDEMHRVLAPGGALLVAESCREFIRSTPVRLLFRHPNETQRTADEYQQLVRDAGFELRDECVSTSTPFWSLPDWGLARRLGLSRANGGEPTEVAMVALKPRS